MSKYFWELKVIYTHGNIKWCIIVTSHTAVGDFCIEGIFLSRAVSS